MTPMGTKSAENVDVDVEHDADVDNYCAGDYRRMSLRMLEAASRAPSPGPLMRRG